MAGPAIGDSPFATRVLEYAPSPGQFVNVAALNDPSRALGPPIGGGTVSPSNTSVVTLGGFGGSITLGFDHVVLDEPPSPANPLGLDVIVFGNAFWVGGDHTRRFAEAAIVEVSRDINANGLADDPWYVIRGSHLPVVPASASISQTFDDLTGDLTYPPSSATWVPPLRNGQWSVTAPALPAGMYAGSVPPILVHPDGVAAMFEVTHGYADCTPTLVLGDIDWPGARSGASVVPDNLPDISISPQMFYSVADDPTRVGVTPGSGGGDAVDIADAVDPQTGTPANLPGIHFIRITTGVPWMLGPFAEVSAEVDAVADARTPMLSDFNVDGVVNVQDIFDYLESWVAGAERADFNRDGATSVQDIFDFLSAWSDES
jgi:hypothetical protein